MCVCGRSFCFAPLAPCGPWFHPPPGCVLVTETVANSVAVCFSQLHRSACEPLATKEHIHPCSAVDRIIYQSLCHLHATSIITVFTALCVCACICVCVVVMTMVCLVSHSQGYLYQAVLEFKIDTFLTHKSHQAKASWLLSPPRRRLLFLHHASLWTLLN